MSSDEPQSWAEAMGKYERDTRNAPAPQGEAIVAKRAFRDSRFNQHEKQSRFHPIQQKYKDTYDEEAAVVREVRRQELHQERAEQQIKIYQTPYNIITGQVRGGAFGAFQDAPKSVNRAPPRGESFPYPRDKTPTKREPRPPANAFQKHRGYDMITNRYNEKEHSPRVQQERQKQLEFAKTSLLKKNRHNMEAFNPITGSYVDPEVEQDHRAQAEKSKKEHRVQALKRMPAKTRISEGMLYNILSLKPNQVFLPEQKRQAEIKSRDPEPTLGLIHNKMVRKRDFEGQDLERRRADARISEKRWNNILRRGYDITSNEQLDHIGTRTLNNSLVINDDGSALDNMVENFEREQKISAVLESESRRPSAQPSEAGSQSTGSKRPSNQVVPPSEARRASSQSNHSRRSDFTKEQSFGKKLDAPASGELLQARGSPSRRSTASSTHSRRSDTAGSQFRPVTVNVYDPSKPPRSPQKDSKSKKSLVQQQKAVKAKMSATGSLSTGSRSQLLNNPLLM